MNNYISKLLVSILLLLASFQLFSQTNDEAIKAQYFFDKGEYDSAIPIYKNLLIRNSSNQIFYHNLLKSFTKTNQLNRADSLVSSMILKFPYRANYDVDLGYIYKKKGNNIESEKHFQEAINKVIDKPNLAYSVSHQFQAYLETRWALKVYLVAEKDNPKYNFSIQKANLYGELGIVDSMLYNYFALIDQQPARKGSVKRYLHNFLKQNPSPEMSNKVKNALLIKVQETSEPAFSELLLWFFVEKKKYSSAFIQAKSLYKRHYADLILIQNLGEDALRAKQVDNAEKCFTYIRSEDTIGANYFKATLFLLELQKDKLRNKMSSEQIISEYKIAINKKAFGNDHFALIISYARFIAFNNNKPEEALIILDNQSKPYQRYDNIMAHKYLLKGDIYLLQQEFTKSFLAYQKAETWSKDQYVTDEAKFKGVKVAFYKGDFKWALEQSKVLKKSVSKWYANNSAELLITLQSSYNSDSSDVPLKLYAKADLLKLQGQTDSAYAYYNQIIQSFPNHFLVPTAQYSQSEILLESMAYNRCIETLKSLYLNYPNNNLSPFALLRLGEVYLNKLKNEEEAKEWLKELMLKFPDSPLAEDARELYRNI